MTLPDPVSTTIDLIVNNWTTHAGGLTLAYDPTEKGEHKVIMLGDGDQILIYEVGRSQRSGHDGYRDCMHGFIGLNHHIQVDIRTKVSRARMIALLDVCMHIFEINRKAPGTGYDKLCFTSGEGHDFSNDQAHHWRFAMDIYLIKEYNEVRNA